MMTPYLLLISRFPQNPLKGLCFNLFSSFLTNLRRGENMGRATRWLKGLFGFTRNSKENRNSNSQQDQRGCSTDRLLSENIPQRLPRKNVSGADVAWLRINSSETEKDQTKSAIAVAAATAAAADAAVVAARAAVAMVKLTHQGQWVAAVSRSGGDERWLAAIKIQTVFRGYLARKALRALRGLVKLQALVRGYLVRRQANGILQSMQALMRAQATARSRRSRHHPLPEHTTNYQSRSRRPMEKLDQMGDKFAAPTHSRRLSASLDLRTVKTVHESLKIVEVDSRRLASRSRRTNTSDFCYPSLSSPFPPEYPWNFHEFDGEATFDECRVSSAQSTPQFSNSTGADNFLGEPFEKRHIPSYMASTHSFKAKLRSLSAPRQRPQLGGLQRRLSLHEMEFPRNSLSGVRIQRSCAGAREAIDFRNAIVR